jgi:adenosylcobinamide kinase/adenosylcobinamide-phosphate guanylyltransferase
MIFIIGGMAQGKYAYARQQFGDEIKVIPHYHEQVREQLKRGEDPLAAAKTLLKEQKEVVIISDELGYGLVPVDAFERQYREQSGRVNCYLAQEAEQVIRVVCGIGTRIK